MSTLLESLLEETAALERGGRFPLHWIFSVSPLLEQSSRPLDRLLVEIRTRCASRGDRVIAAGFRGAVHPLLTAEELDKELVWCWSHPAAAAFAELFAAAPAAIMPEYPDPWRELGGAFYSRRGYKMMGLPQDPARPYRFLRRTDSALANGARTVLFSYVPLSAPAPGDFSRQLRGLAAGVPAREKALFVVLDTASLANGALANGALANGAPATGGPAPLLGRLLEALNTRYAVRPASLADPELFKAESESDSHPLDYLPVRSDPVRRRQWLQAEPLRRKAARKDSDVRHILETLSAGPHRETSGADEADAPDRRTLDAAMTGDVVLTGERFDACFSDGRLTGISAGGRRLLDSGAAQAYLELQGTRHEFHTVSAFSFQGPQEHGLRTVLALQLPRAESRLVVDCYFHESSPDLILDFRLTYPELEERDRITRIAPYEIPLLTSAPGKALSVRARFPDRDEAEHRFAPASTGADEETRLLSGSEFIFDCGGQGLFLRFNGSPRLGLMEFCRRRQGGGLLLCANLNGSYREAGAGLYSGLRERFSFRMGLVS